MNSIDKVPYRDILTGHTAHWVSAESVPVFWPHVREVAAATWPATPADIIPITGSSIAKRGTCCPA